MKKSWEGGIENSFLHMIGNLGMRSLARAGGGLQPGCTESQGSTPAPSLAMLGKTDFAHQCLATSIHRLSELSGKRKTNKLQTMRGSKAH